MMHIDGLFKPKNNLDILKNEYSINIDNIEYTIPVADMFDFMTLPDDEFKKVCTDKQISKVHNIPKEHFAFACINYMSEKNNRDSRFATPQICRRFKILLHYELIDFEAVNHDLEIVDKVYNKIELSNEVKEMIIKNKPSELSLLETAIYIYIKMCQTFTYDREFFSQNQTYKKELSYITTISPNNLEVTCFEFAVIYGQLLANIGINFRSYYGKKQRIYELRSIMDNGEKEYGQKHAFTEFRVGKFLIDADAMESILEGDLIDSKLYLPLNGLQCINSNRETQEEFEQTLNKVYTIIKSEKKLPQIDKSYLEHIEDLSYLNRINILQKQINLLNLKGLDAYSYIVNMKRKLYTEEELKSNLNIRIIRTNNPEDINKNADVLMIITINKRDFELNDFNNEYYILTPENELIPITYEKLKSKFINGEFEYISITDATIPDITSISHNSVKTFKRK